jgi:hypothetical protein
VLGVFVDLLLQVENTSLASVVNLCVGHLLVYVQVTDCYERNKGYSSDGVLLELVKGYW